MIGAAEALAHAGEFPVPLLLYVGAALLLTALLFLLRRVRRAVSDARRSRARARLKDDLLERIREAVYVLRVEDGKFLLVNRRFEELFGVSRELAESGNLSPLDLVAKEDRALVADRVAKRVRGEELPARYQFRVASANGNNRRVEVETVPSERDGERVVYGICRDVTEEVAALEALRREQSQLLTIFDGIDQPIYVADLESREILYANRGLRRIADGDPIGRTCCQVLGGCEVPCDRCPSDALAGSSDGLIREPIQLKNGRTYRRYVRRIRWPDGRRVRFELAVDVTSERALEEKQRQTDKLVALDTLIGGMAHELNNLLGGVVGYCSLALNRMDEDRDVRNEIERCGAAAHQASKLVDQLLCFSERRPEESLPLDLNALITRVADGVRDSAGVDIDVEISPADAPLMVLGDDDRLAEALVQLARNAFQAMSAGGRVTIEARLCPSPRNILRTDGERAVGLHGEISIADTGTGVDPEISDRILEPFFSTRPGRVGLGLSVAYGAVRAAGGYLEVLSEPGVGTEVVMGIPLLAPSTPAFPATPVSHSSTLGGTVLIVDDEPIIRDLAGEILLGSGYTVRKATGGEEALKALEETDSGVDVVLLDLAMPGLSGQETARRIRGIGSSVPILISSGFAGESPESLCTELEAQGFLPKPYEVDQLIDAVRGILVLV